MSWTCRQDGKIRRSGGNHLWKLLLGGRRRSWKDNINTGLNEMSLMDVRWMEADGIVSNGGL
jgi:hypothetical protein